MELSFNTIGLTGTFVIGPSNDYWRTCYVAVKSYGFSADYSCSIYSPDLRKFHSDLESAVSALGRESVVELLQTGIRLSLKLDKCGHVEGQFEFHQSAGPTLTGKFDADQTYLVGWINQLEAIFSSQSN